MPFTEESLKYKPCLSPWHVYVLSIEDLHWGGGWLSWFLTTKIKKRKNKKTKKPTHRRSFKSLQQNMEISLFSFYLLSHWNTWIWDSVIPGRKNRVPRFRGKRARPLEPSHLWHCDAAFLGQLLFGFFTGVGVTEVWVKIFIQDFGGLFTEVTPFSSMTRSKRELQL